MKFLFRFIPVLLLLGGIFSCTRTVVPSRQNQSFEYLSQTNVRHDLRMEGDSLRIFMRFADVGFFAFPNQMAVKYSVYLNYEKTDIILQDSLVQPARRFIKTPNALFFDFKIPVQRLKYPAVLLVKLYSRNDAGNVLYHDIAIMPAVKNKTYVLLDAVTKLPLFRDFVRVNEPFFISQTGTAVPGELVLYETDFKPARPPMAGPETKTTPTLKRLEVLPFLFDTIRVGKPGLYGLELAGKQVGGLLVENGLFPELTTASDLIQPLIYLTTSEERKKLYNAPDPKIAVDNFWLKITPHQQDARQLIRTYYQRTVNANLFFSAHKPGWQTDRGMIYMVFGPPEIVNRYAGYEQWTYIATGLNPELRFVFNKKDNTFTQNHYELIRGPVYEGFWYNMVEQWRSGIIEN